MIRMAPDPLPQFRPLTGVYEPSAIQQLPDGRFLVVEDEKAHPFSLVTLHPDGGVTRAALEPGLFHIFDNFWKLDDLEGLALDGAGQVYAITSHSRADDGGEKKSRDKLVRFRVEGERVVDTRVSHALKPALRAAHPLLAAAAKVRDVKDGGGLNIEALEFDRERGHLLIGLRGPLLGGLAVIVTVENPDELFESDAPARISPALTTLDLGGHGIRGMGHVPGLGGHLLIGGPVDREAVQFRLWFWSGRPGDAASRVEISGLAGLEHAEGVCPAIVDGRPCLVLVSDDGDRKAGRFARYLILDVERLRLLTPWPANPT